MEIRDDWRAVLEPFVSSGMSATFLGESIEGASRDELMGLLGWSYDQMQKERERHEASVRFYADLFRAREAR